MDTEVVHDFVDALEAQLPSAAAPLELVGVGALPSVFATTDLAAASVGVAGRAAARLVGSLSGAAPPVRVDARLSSLWFGSSLLPDGWTPPPVWDDIAGVYEDGSGRWIRLHTNAPHHRAAALDVLGCAPERDAVGAEVAGWDAFELETEILASGGCAAVMLSEDEWRRHEQGTSVAAEPVLHHGSGDEGPAVPPAPPERPLAGVRVLDLTRVLAGPVATRLLAGLGADVLRIDPPDWDEPSVAAEVTLGKRCARLDLHLQDDRDVLLALLEGAHIVVHGYRPGALDDLDLGPDVRRRRAPGLVDVSLDAYGWTGPWSSRRGFDSLVQMSTGVAHTGMVRTGSAGPTPLPVQALDHATGHLLAAAALHGWADRVESGRGSSWRTSLARVAAVLAAGPRTDPATSVDRVTTDDAAGSEQTPWGRAWRLAPPVAIEGTPLRWDRPSSTLGSEPAPLGWRR